MPRIRRILASFVRAVSLVLIAVCLTTALVRNAPGYLVDAGEMDAGHADVARARLSSLAEQDVTTVHALAQSFSRAFRGDLGESRQFGVSVRSLLQARLRSSGILLLRGVVFGWFGAICMACVLTWRRRKASAVLAVVFGSTLLAVPLGAIATVCLTLDRGGPVMILALTVGVRSFKLLHSLLLQVLEAPCIEHARAQGLRSYAIFSSHVSALLRNALPQLLMASIIVALEAMVPLEVIFDRPGIGQLAWNAAMNRDLPVLQAVTAIVAMCVACSGILASATTENEVKLCAP